MAECHAWRKGGSNAEYGLVQGTEPEGESAPEDPETEEGHSVYCYDGSRSFRDRLPDGRGTVSTGRHCGNPVADHHPGDPGNSKMTPQAAAREAKKEKYLTALLWAEIEGKSR